MWSVFLPQVIQNTLPATGNQFIIHIKDTSVLNVIDVTELYFQVKTVAGISPKYFQSTEEKLFALPFPPVQELVKKA